MKNGFSGGDIEFKMFGSEVVRELEDDSVTFSDLFMNKLIFPLKIYLTNLSKWALDISMLDQ